MIILVLCGNICAPHPEPETFYPPGGSVSKALNPKKRFRCDWQLGEKLPSLKVCMMFYPTACHPFAFLRIMCENWGPHGINCMSWGHQCRDAWRHIQRKACHDKYMAGNVQVIAQECGENDNSFTCRGSSREATWWWAMQRWPLHSLSSSGRERKERERKRHDLFLYRALIMFLDNKKIIVHF